MLVRAKEVILLDNETTSTLAQKLKQFGENVIDLQILSFFNFNEDKEKQIVEFLKENRTLQILRLGPASVTEDVYKDGKYQGAPGEKDIEILCLGLAENTSIKELLITGSSASRDSLAAIASVLVAQAQSETNPKYLRTIKLPLSFGLKSYNLIDFATILARHQNYLEFLDLSSNSLDNQVADILVGMACSLPNLRAIRLNDNALTDAGAIVLSDIPELTETRVGLKGNSLSPDMNRSIRETFLKLKGPVYDQLYHLNGTFFNRLPRELQENVVEKIKFNAYYDQFYLFKDTFFNLLPRELQTNVIEKIKGYYSQSISFVS